VLSWRPLSNEKSSLPPLLLIGWEALSWRAPSNEESLPPPYPLADTRALPPRSRPEARQDSTEARDRWLIRRGVCL